MRVSGSECPRCSHVGSATARFCEACGAPLPGAPRGYTPRHLAESVLRQRSALEGERKQVTVLFVDLKGSMEIAAEVDAEEWHDIMDRFFAIVSGAVHRYEGTINQYTGDGAMALFGAPLALEDHAERACLAALDLASELARFGEELRRAQGLGFAARIGLNSGEVVVGRIGDDLRMDYTAQGHTVGLASRMEQLAEPGRIYLTEATAAQLAGRFRLRDLGEHNVRGVREPVRVHALEGPGAVRTRLDVSRARGFSPLVGRGDEARALEAALDRAAAGDGVVVAVSGEAGVGKSRLGDEVATRARERGFAVHAAQAVAYGRSVPLVPVVALLRGVFGVAESDDEEEARRKVAGTLLLLDPGLHDSLPLVFDLLGIAEADGSAPAKAVGGDPEARQKRLLALVRRVLETRMARAPLLLVVEDLHWADDASESFLRAIAEIVRGARGLLLVNFRPEYGGDWIAASERIALAPLGPSAAVELLCALLGADPSLGDLAARIAERTAGNPFFIEETVRSLVDEGGLAGAPGAYRLRAEVATPALPPSVQALLAARIDRLPDGEKAVLETASVIGKTFSVAILERVTGLDEPVLRAALDRLVVAGLVHTEDAASSRPAAFTFRHPLTQEVAYRAQLSGRREAAHAAVADALEAAHAPRLDEVAALLAHHRESAGDLRAAARWARRAAERTMRGDVVAAVPLWEKARDLASRLPRDAESVEIGVWAGIQLLNLGWRVGLTPDEARRLFEEGLELSAYASDSSAASGFHVTYGAVRAMTGEPEQALELVVEATRLARAAGDVGTEIATLAALVQTQIMTGRLREALDAIEGAIAVCAAHPGEGRQQTGFEPRLWFPMMRGGMRIETGDLGGAASDFALVLEEARRAGEFEIAGWAQEMTAYLDLWRGDRDGALAHARQAVQVAEQMGSAFSQVSAYCTLGHAHRRREEWSDATAALEHARELIHVRRTFAHCEPAVLSHLAEVHAAEGRAEEARAAADEAVALARGRGARFMELIASVARAQVLRVTAGRAAAEEVLTALARAESLVEHTGAASWLALVHVERAGLRRALGDEAAARRESDLARRRLEKIGAPERARTLG